MGGGDQAIPYYQSVDGGKQQPASCLFHFRGRAGQAIRAVVSVWPGSTPSPTTQLQLTPRTHPPPKPPRRTQTRQQQAHQQTLQPISSRYSGTIQRKILLPIWGVPILENESYADFRIDGDPLPPALAGLSDGGDVMYVSSFTKLLGCGLRVGLGQRAPTPPSPAPKPSTHSTPPHARRPRRTHTPPRYPNLIPRASCCRPPPSKSGC